MKKIAIIGGTGQLGKALTLRLAQAGYEVIMGSRDLIKAQDIIQEISQQINSKKISAEHYRNAAKNADIIILAIPYPNSTVIATELAEQFRNKILIDTTVPLSADYTLTSESTAAKLQKKLGENVKVVAAFQTIAANLLSKSHLCIDSDALICGNDKIACEIVMEMIQNIGLNCVYCGGIEYSLAVQNMAITLLAMNKLNTQKYNGIKFTNLQKAVRNDGKTNSNDRIA